MLQASKVSLTSTLRKIESYPLRLCLRLTHTSHTHTHTHSLSLSVCTCVWVCISVLSRSLWRRRGLLAYVFEFLLALVYPLANDRKQNWCATHNNLYRWQTAIGDHTSISSFYWCPFYFPCPVSFAQLPSSSCFLPWFFSMSCQPLLLGSK